MFSLTTIALVACIAIPAPKTRIDPHVDTAGTGGCASCHMADPAGRGVSGELRGTINEVCTRCHGDEQLGVSHPIEVEPGETAHSVEPEDLPLEDDRITCVTCHDPHGRWVTLTSLSDQQKPAFSEYVGGREVAYYKAYYLRLQECGEGYTSLCISCHPNY